MLYVCSHLIFLLPTALSRKVKQPVASVRPSVSTISFKPTDLWTWVCVCVQVIKCLSKAPSIKNHRACVRVMTIARLELKVKIIGKGQGHLWPRVDTVICYCTWMVPVNCTSYNTVYTCYVAKTRFFHTNRCKLQIERQDYGN